MFTKNKLLSSTFACVITAGAFSISTPAMANDAGAFIGGVFATKLMQNSNRRANAEEEQAYAAQRPVSQSPAPAASSASQSPQDRIKQLDKLAAGGYITPAEYKSKKQAILNSM